MAVPRMALFSQRSLTPGEVALGRLMFAGEVDYARVRVAQAPKAGFAAMVPLGATIVYSTWRAPLDASAASKEEQGWFIHELAHVWQAMGGTVLAAAKLKALGRRAYAYRLTPGKPWRAYNIEQQAEIARHLFLARIGAPKPGQPERAALESVWPIKPD